MKLVASLFLLNIIAIVSFGQKQQQSVRSFQLEQYLKNTPNQNEMISFFVKADKTVLQEKLAIHKGRCKGKVKDWIFVSVPRNAITDFLNETPLSALNFRSYQGRPMNDTMRVNNRINAIHNGDNPLQTPYTGKGVIMGFIDTGLDWQHPDFLNPADSATRVLAIWDQTLSVNQFTPAVYGYGQDWDSTEIMQGLCTNNDQYGHGTTVAGAGCGNAFANGLNKGVAPETEIIAVESNFSAGNWLATVVDAVEYIYHIADSLEKPCAINASVGTYLGSHDGLDPYALYIDSLINRKKGHLMVASAGNSGAWGKYHLATTQINDTAFTWFAHNPTSGLGGAAVYFELWADTVDFNAINYTVGVDKVIPSFENRGKGNYFNISQNLNAVTYDTVRNQNNDVLATVQYWSELRDGQYLLQVYLPAPDSNQYNFRFETVGTGSFDVWSSSVLGMSDIIDDTVGIANFTEAHKYRLPDSLKTIVSSFQCSPSVITVGNYYNDSGYVNLDSTWTSNGGVRGKLAPTSSKGPTRDNRIKPELAASGHGTNSALPLNLINYYINHATLDSTLAIGGMHRRNGGTSMSSPVVAGVGALLLEKCNNMTSVAFKDALINNTYADNFTGTLPNYSFGYGKLDGFNTLLSTSYQNSIIGELAFCEGDSSQLSISNTVVAYNWNNNDINATIYSSNTSNHYLITTDSLGCMSDTTFFQTVAHPLPTVPNLAIDFDSIVANNTNGNTIEWYRDGQLLAGEQDSVLFADENGNYAIEVTNQYGCVAYSDTLVYNSVGIAMYSNNTLIYPVPASDYIRVETQYPIETVAVYDLSGKLIDIVKGVNNYTVELKTIKWATGVYNVKLSTSQNTTVQKKVIHR